MKKRWLVVILVGFLATGLYAARSYVDLLLRYTRAGTKPCALGDLIQWTQYQERIRLKKDRLLAESYLVRREDSYDLWQTPLGEFWVPAGSDYNFFWNLGEQALDIYRLRQHIRAGESIVIDCGAHVGTFAQNALRLGARLVVAVEPAPENLACLRRNLAREIETGRVVVIPKGVWDRDARLQLKVVPGNSGADTFVLQQPGAVSGPEIELTTVDKIVQELQLERVDFIKMDIEGAEQKALKGAEQTIRQFLPVLAIAAYHRPDDPQEIPAILQSFGNYQIHCVGWEPQGEALRPDVLLFVPQR